MTDSFRQSSRKRRNRTALRSILSGVVASFTLTLGACHDATGPSDVLPGLTIRTPETVHFTFNSPGDRNEIIVPVTITNGSGKTLNLGYCSEELERISVPGWKSVYSPICLAVVRTLPPIPAGTSLTFNFYASDTPPQYEGFRFTDSPNVYRVRVALWIVEGGASQPLPRDASVTNPFKVEQ
jgi:hypothetical protein